MGSVNTTQYIRKPLYVAAVRITASNFDEIAAWCQGEIQQDEIPDKGAIKKFVRVRVHNPKNPRQTKAFVGDWLLYTERGYKVYTNKAFHASFDAVTNGNGNGHSPENGELNGSEEVFPGLSLNEAVAMIRDGRLQLDPTAQQAVEAEESERAEDTAA
jgi:hypothetical protein